MAAGERVGFEKLFVGAFEDDRPAATAFCVRSLSVLMSRRMYERSMRSMMPA